MDGNLPPWNKHGGHNTRGPHNIAGEHQEDHNLIEDSSAAGEPVSSLSSCMSGAFKALLPDYHGTSSEMTTVKYSYSPNSLVKPGTSVDEKIVVGKREKSDYLKDPLCESSTSVTHMLPPRCSQYVPQEKDREVAQGNCNWTSVIKDALEMSNGMEMEQTLSMDVCGPLMDLNPVCKGPETEAKFTLMDDYKIAGSKLNEKPDGQGVKGEPDTFISMLSDGISKKQDVLEMGENDEPSMLVVGTSQMNEELGMTGNGENEPGFLPGFNRSSYTPFSSSEGFMKSEEFLGIPTVKQSVEHILQGTTQGPKSCKDVSPRKTAGTSICFKHSTVNDITVLEGSSVYGLHHLDQKDCHQAEVTDGNASVNTHDHSLHYDVQDKRVNARNLHASETTLIEQSAACLPDSSKLKKQDCVLSPASVGSQNTALVECENSKLLIPTEDRTSLSVPGQIQNVFQKTRVSTKNAERDLKMETESSPDIQNFSSGSETVPHQTVVSNKIQLDYKCKDSQIKPQESDILNPSTVLLPCDEKVQNSEKNERTFLNITSESSFPPPSENVHAAPPFPTSRIDCSSQPNLQKALQKHKKARKIKKSELEELNGPLHKSNKRDDFSVYNSVISDSAEKPDAIECEDTNQNFSLVNHGSTAPKEEDLIANGDVNPPSSRRKSQLRMTQLELVADTAETSQNPDHNCSETSQVKAPSTAMIDRKAVSRRKLKNKTRLRLKAKKSAGFSNQCLSQGTVLSADEDCTSHFQASGATLVKEVSNPEIIQQATSRLESSIAECSPEKYTLQTLQSKGDPHDEPTTFTEVEADLMDFKKHPKVRRPGIKTSRAKNDEHETSLLNSPSLLESVSQADSVSSSVTESSNIISPQKNPKKSKQNKRADINKATQSQQDDIPLPLSKSREHMVISNTRIDDCDTTLLDIQPSIATLKRIDSVPTAGTEVESPVVLSTQRKSLKKKRSDIKCKVNQTTAQQSVLNPLSESDASIVQPTTRRFSPRKTFDTIFSHNAVSESCENVHLNQSISSVDSMSSTEIDISGVSQKKTEKTSSKRRKTKIKFMEGQTSTTSQKDDVIVLPSEDFASVLVSNPEKTVKVESPSRNKTNDDPLKDNLVEDTILAFVTQENSFSPSKIDSRRTKTLKKPRKKIVTKIKNEAEGILDVNQHDDFVAITSKSSADIVASSSPMTLKEKRLVENAIAENVKGNHATALFIMQTSTATLQHTECVSTSFAHSTPKKSRKMSDIKGEATTPEVDQSMQQELHQFDSASATEMDNSDGVRQKKIKVKTKRRKKVTKRKTHVTQVIKKIGEPSLSATMQQEYSVSNRNTNSRSEELKIKRMKKKTSLKVRNVQPEDHAEHHSFLSALLPPPISLGKDATQDPCIKTDICNESAESHVENQVFSEDVAFSQSSPKKVKKTPVKQLLVQKEDKEQGNIQELALGEDEKSDMPSVVREVAFENFETLEADGCDHQTKEKAKISKQIAETHEFANISLSQEKNTGSDEAGVMVTFTQIQDFCKLDDGQTVEPQPEKEEEDSRIKDLKATKTPKTKSRKARRKKIAGLLSRTVKDEEHKDISYENRIVCDFQNNTKILISNNSQRTAVIPEEPVMKSRKSTRTQKTNSGTFIQNVSTQGSLDIIECHTRLGETLSGSMQPDDCEGQHTVEQKSPRRGTPPSLKSKKQKLSIAHLEDNTTPSAHVSDFSSCQDSTETLSSSMQPADCEGQHTVKQKSRRRGRPPSIKSKKQKLSLAHLEENTAPSVQSSNLSSCPDNTETFSSSMQPADCEDQCIVNKKSPRRGRPPSLNSKKQELSIACLEDNTSPSVQIIDPSSCQDSTETLSSSMQPADCEGQHTVEQKSRKRGRPPSIKKKRQKLPISYVKNNISPSVQFLDPDSCRDTTETLSSSMQPTDCEGQYTVKQKSRKRGRPPSIKNKKQKLSIAHLEDKTSPSVQFLDLSSCQESTETLSSSMHPDDCEGPYTKQRSPRQGRPSSIKNNRRKLPIAHLEDNTSPSVQISDLSSCQDSTENTAKAAASPVKQVDNVTFTKQLGTDPSESLQSVADDLSHNIPAPKHKKGKNFKRLKLSSLRLSSRTSEPSVKGFQKADIDSIPQKSTKDFNEEGETSLQMPRTAKKLEICEKTAIQDGDVLADIKIERKATVKILKGAKRGRKRRKSKKPTSDLATDHEELQRFTTKNKNDERQDCSEPAKSLLTTFSITNECATEDQYNPVTSENNDKEKTSTQMSTSSTHLSSNLMKEVKKYNEHDAEPNGNHLFAVTDNSGLSGGVSSGICNLISNNVVKEESEHIFLDTKIKPNVELKCTPQTAGQSVEMSGKKMLDNLFEIENTFQTSTKHKMDAFTKDSEECVVMPKKVSKKKTMRSKPKEIMKKPLTCKYCGVSFRHITAYAVHQRIHTGDKPYKCKICGKTFAQLSKLKSHRNVHKQDASFPCPCCSQKFLQKENLLCHFKVHLHESKTNTEPQTGIKSKKNTLSDVCSETPNNYRCLICKKNFLSRVKLQNHMQSHEVEKPLTCKDCGKKFWKPSSLTAHEKSHWPVKPYACSICGKGFNLLKALKKHSQDHAGETPFSCFHCGHAFSALSALRMHQASKTCIARRNDGARGNIEGFIVSQGVDGQVNTPVFFKCQICKQLFRKWCQYTLHLQTHTSSPPYICFSCGQCYEKDSEMNVHCEVCCQSSGEDQICGASLSEIMQGVIQTYPLKCTSKQTPSSTGFHLNSQMPNRSEQLPQLPQSIDVELPQTKETDLSEIPKMDSTLSPIKLPIAQTPTHSDVRCISTSSPQDCIEISQSLLKFKCSRCGQRFEQYRTLSAHLQMHAPGFRYTCAQCGQFFERWSKLWLHQRRHRLKSRSYSCNQCNLQFRFLSSFKEHMIDHAGEKAYACSLCPRTFIQESSLHAHQCESHKQLCKSLKCDVCSKTFSSLTNLIKHSLLHNGSTSHICLACNLSFTNTRVLKEHLKTHTTDHGPVLPDIPSKPLDFPHKCKRCKASFSTGELLYAHQIRHSRDAKSNVHSATVPTSKLSDSCSETPSTLTSTQKNHISNLKLDGIPDDESLYVYSHPDRLYVPFSRRVQIPVINLDPDEQEVSNSQTTSPELPNSEITAQSDSTHLPQATSGQETTNLNSSESPKEKANGDYSCTHQRTRFVETSVDMEVEATAQEESSEEGFECADCTEKLSSVLNLYEHYILHAMGDAYVQVH
ncbi:uncharacterized protein si:ch73-347e22.4 isoform X2 [Pimephales promelas]|uniref:uncharacterized protein si:ch73-347e22.4 isoform X2 n=1 Tax=Pimephales promelas TaxID=90988 RepID=UPI001955E45E|nr:uncharacterized protein si:ch73-347e22.4 isoform X2 [Pimephales promelas]